MVISAPWTSLYVGAIHLGALHFILDPLRNSIWDQTLLVPWSSLHASGHLLVLRPCTESRTGGQPWG